MNNKAVNRIVLSALFAALAYVATSIIRIPTFTGYVNIGDTIVLLSAWLIGGIACGTAVAAILIFVIVRKKKKKSLTTS